MDNLESTINTGEPLEQPLDLDFENDASRISGKLKKSILWNRMTQWEYWPFTLLYVPVYFYFIGLMAKCRSFFFFTASNPGIHFGGMLGESKMEIFDILPKKYLPVTYRVSAEISKVEFFSQLKSKQIDFPFILKPDIGERGWMVELIKNEDELERYLDRINVDFLVQEYVDYPIELGVFYYRYPDMSRGTVSSIVQKDLLGVKGDGRKSVRDLIQENPRAKMHEESIARRDPKILEQIPKYGELVELVSIGNHSRGTTFLNGNHFISEKLIHVIDEISKKIAGFYFGRYDIRCSSIEDLCAGNNIKILELNGAGAEPGHIYQPGYSLIRAYRDIMHHLKVLAEISKINHKRGTPYMSLKDGLSELQKIRRYNKQRVNL